MGFKTTKRPNRIVGVVAPAVLVITMLAVGLLAYKLVVNSQAPRQNKETIRPTPTAGATSTAVQIPAGSGRCHDVAISRDGKFFVGALDNGAAMFSMTTGTLMRTLTGSGPMSVSALALSLDGKRVVAAASLPDRVPRLVMWDGSTGELIFALKGHTDTVDKVSITADGTRAVSLSESMADRTIRVWDLTTGSSRVVDMPTDLGLRSLAMTEDGARAYAEIDVEGDSSTVDPNSEGGAIESHLVEIDLDRRKVARDFGNTGSSISDLAISPDGRMLVSGQWDGNSYVWDLRSGKVVETLDGHSDWVVALSFSADGILASGSVDRSIRIWHLGTSSPIQTLKERLDVESVAIAPDAHALVSCLSNGTVRKWTLN